MPKPWEMKRHDDWLWKVFELIGRVANKVREPQDIEALYPPMLNEDEFTCHCGELVAIVTDVCEFKDLGPGPYMLCEECLPCRCDADPFNCPKGPRGRAAVAA